MKLILSLILFSSLSYAQNNNWAKLKKSAHAIGFCIYNINEAYCNEHKAILNKHEGEEDEEVHYFLMKEKWAKKRITDWAQQQKSHAKTHILLFDINQGFKYKNKLNNKKTNNRFYIIDLKDQLILKIGYKKYNITISNNKPNILENSLWREFMSGRLGLLKKRIEFNAFSKSKPNRHLKKFKKHFISYRTNLLKQ
ncbi:hypothetical protein [Pontimicrobium sp. MEBiC01747]